MEMELEGSYPAWSPRSRIDIVFIRRDSSCCGVKHSLGRVIWGVGGGGMALCCGQPPVERHGDGSDPPIHDCRPAGRATGARGLAHRVTVSRSGPMRN